MARWRGSRLRWAIAGLLVVALVAAVIVAWPLVQRYTGAAPPAQFYEKVELDPALTRDYPRVLGSRTMPATIWRRCQRRCAMEPTWSRST
jgi:hypothetical protein